MEKELNLIATEATNDPKISGYLCADDNGLCLTANGVANEKSSGLIVSIAQMANRLDKGNSPVIYIESDNSKILIKSKDKITTALYKTS